MSQVSTKLRRGEGKYFHWCPACNEMHVLLDSWKFDGNLESPTFMPSFDHTDGTDWRCHYYLIAGELRFEKNCSHAYAGQVVPLPDLPKEN